MQVETMTSLNALPNSEEALSDALLLKHYYSLYYFHSYGERLPADFPIELRTNYSDASCLTELKKLIANLAYTVNENLGIQYEYMRNYNTLYMHYVGVVELPTDFPRTILEQFPNSSYKQILRSEIAALQYIINHEKVVV